MRRSPRLVGTVGLLILALVVCAVLAYQAWDAARSQRETADNTLRDYARIADWQLTQQAKNQLLTQVVTALSSQASQVDPAHLERTVMTPAQVEDVARVVVEWCRCLSGVRYFFRYDWRDGTLRTTETDLSDADLAWARDTVVAYTKSLPMLRDRRVLAFGSPDGRFGPLKNLAVILTNDSYAMLFGQRNKRAELLVFVVARDIERGEPVVVYGFATDPKPFLSPVFENIRGKSGAQTALLPRSLIGALSPDSILSI